MEHNIIKNKEMQYDNTEVRDSRKSQKKEEPNDEQMNKDNNKEVDVPKDQNQNQDEQQNKIIYVSKHEYSKAKNLKRIASNHIEYEWKEDDQAHEEEHKEQEANMNVNIQQNIQGQNVQKEGPKVLIKEVTYTENQNQNGEPIDEEKIKLRCLTLKKKEELKSESQGEDEQPTDEQPQDENLPGQEELQSEIKKPHLKVEKENKNEEEQGYEEEHQEEHEYEQEYEEEHQEEQEYEEDHQDEQEYEHEYQEEQENEEDHQDEQEYEHEYQEEQENEEDHQEEQGDEEYEQENQEQQGDEEQNEEHIEEGEKEIEDDNHEEQEMQEDNQEEQEIIHQENQGEQEYLNMEGQGYGQINNQYNDIMISNVRNQGNIAMSQGNNANANIITGNISNQTQQSMGITGLSPSFTFKNESDKDNQNIGSSRGQINNQSQTRTQIITSQFITSQNVNQESQGFQGQNPVLMPHPVIQAQSSNIINNNNNLGQKNPAFENLMSSNNDFFANMQTTVSYRYDQMPNTTDPIKYSFRVDSGNNNDIQTSGAFADPKPVINQNDLINSNYSGAFISDSIKSNESKGEKSSRLPLDGESKKSSIHKSDINDLGLGPRDSQK